MDGSLAVVFIVTSLTDMVLNDCQTACLQQTDAIGRLSLQAAQVQFGSANIATEGYIGYDLGRGYGPYQPTIGVSVTSDNDVWIGAGAKWSTQGVIDSPFFIESSLMPGYYSAGSGPNIGGTMQFRSAVGGGYTFDNGGTVTLLYDHRSNADTQIPNPGLETLSIRYAFTLP